MSEEVTIKIRIDRAEFDRDLERIKSDVKELCELRLRAHNAKWWNRIAERGRAWLKKIIGL